MMMQQHKKYKSCKSTNENNPSSFKLHAWNLSLDWHLRSHQNTHQVIVRPLIFTSLKIVSLRGYKIGIPNNEVREGNLTSIRPSIRFLMSIGFGWNRGMSCRVTSLIRSLWARCFLSFMILTIHACEPPVRPFPTQGTNILPLFGVFVPRRSCHASPSALRWSRLSTRQY